MGKRARKASAGLAQQDEQMHQERQQGVISSVAEVRLDQIQKRPFKCTRTLQSIHVLELALSIEKIGLIEPIVVDQEYHLLAGRHRLLALKLLSLETRESVIEDLKNTSDKAQLALFKDQLRFLPDTSAIDFQKIPVRVFPFLASEDLSQALKVESIENMQRQDHTLKEVLQSEFFQLYTLFVNRGDEELKERSKKGQKYLKPVLTAAVGKVIRGVQRKRKDTEDLKKNRPSESQVDLIAKTIRNLNQQMKSAHPKTVKKLKENDLFLDDLRHLMSFFKGR